MRLLKFLSAGIFVFTSFAALVYLLWVINEKNQDIKAMGVRIKNDSINIAYKEQEIEKLSLAVNSLKGAYDNIQNAFHSLSDRFLVMDQHNDSLTSRIAYLTLAMKKHNENIRKEERKTKKRQKFQEEFNSQEIAAIVNEINNRNTTPTHYRTLTDLEKAENEKALLIVDNFYVWSPDRTGSEVINTKSKKLNFSFEVLENTFSNKGKKDLFVQIIKPDGNVYINLNEGGFFISGGVNKPYTAKIPVQYNNQTKKITFSFSTEKDYQKGSYKVVVFESGNEIGNAHFVME
jgi:uncharacterized coiled-coil protein SlyX